MTLLDKGTMVSQENALPGRESAIPVQGEHFVTGNPMMEPFPDNLSQAVFGLGCFWGAERRFWTMPGVYSTAVGYAGGYTPNPTYEEVCSGLTGHTEVVLIIFDPDKLSYGELLTAFWESHNPTQGMQQGNDCGTQYRSCIYTEDTTQEEEAALSRENFQTKLDAAGYGSITTEIKALELFYYAEACHQQYLAKNPGGYCGLGGTGISCG
ncbi:MAG: peptide-methionine (S)-S-oxide reductase MsrA [Gammaproteobacteria bacterium]|nr:peptide-methionine (S)-S-oxide reductase MsrA [Gammaproteobacteria bacterium]